MTNSKTCHLTFFIFSNRKECCPNMITSEPPPPNYYINTALDVHCAGIRIFGFLAKSRKRLGAASQRMFCFQRVAMKVQVLTGRHFTKMFFFFAIVKLKFIR